MWFIALCFLGVIAYAGIVLANAVRREAKAQRMFPYMVASPHMVGLSLREVGWLAKHGYITADQLADYKSFAEKSRKPVIPAPIQLPAPIRRPKDKREPLSTYNRCLIVMCCVPPLWGVVLLVVSIRAVWQFGRMTFDLFRDYPRPCFTVTALVAPALLFGLL